MNVRNLPPNEKIAAYVDRILVIENCQVVNSFSLPLFANGSPTLLFKSSRGRMKNNITTNLTLFGQTILPEAITFTEDFTLVAYFFKPYSLLPIFGVTPLELTDRPIDLNLLSPQKARTLQEQLLNADGPEQLILSLDSYIANLVAHSRSDNAVISYATGRIAAYTSKETLVAVQKELHVTERTFQRMFEKNIGIAPNIYRRITQFNAAFQQLNSKRYYKLSDLAFENGYADQSHYIRAFKEFTSLTPKEYLNFGA